MKTVLFQIYIKAPKEKVWAVLWNKKSYCKWTNPFCETSKLETDWEEGGKIYFLSSEVNGIFSEIIKNDPFDAMYFRHKGLVVNGCEDTLSAEAREWQGAKENYDLTDADEGVNLKVRVDVPDAHFKDFEKAWPAALKIVKALSENSF